MRLEFAVTAADGECRLSDFLRRNGLTCGLIKAIKYLPGGLLVDGAPAHTDLRLRPGQKVSAALPPEPPTAVAAEPVALDIVYEDEFAVVLNKPAGILVHPSAPGCGGTLANGWRFLMAQRGTPCPFRPVNRIDRNTSGLVLAAKNSFAAPLLARSFTKFYWAVAEGELPAGESGVIDLPIARAEGSIICRRAGGEGKPSRTAYTVLAAAGGHTLLRAVPLTGRTHQIRVHFAALGHPLAGDDLYGGSRGLIARQALHAGYIAFVPPRAAAPVCVSAPLPADFCALLSAAGLPQPVIGPTPCG